MQYAAVPSAVRGDACLVLMGCLTRLGSCLRAKPPNRLIAAEHREEGMATRLNQRGWTAAQHLAPCVICHQPAIPAVTSGKPCHWTCVKARVNEHQGSR